VVERLAEGQVVNQVQVDEEMARYAKVALDRMLAVE
jgi:quinolinate synthase